MFKFLVRVGLAELVFGPLGLLFEFVYVEIMGKPYEYVVLTPHNPAVWLSLVLYVWLAWWVGGQVWGHLLKRGSVMTEVVSNDRINVRCPTCGGWDSVKDCDVYCCGQRMVLEEEFDPATVEE